MPGEWIEVYTGQVCSWYVAGMTAAQAGQLLTVGTTGRQVGAAAVILTDSARLGRSGKVIVQCLTRRSNAKCLFDLLRGKKAPTTACHGFAVSEVGGDSKAFCLSHVAHMHWGSHYSETSLSTACQQPNGPQQYIVQRD
jgi:hypothetical protein